MPPCGVASSAQQSNRAAAATSHLVFTLLLLGSVIGALQIALNWEHQPLDRSLLHILARASTALFLALVAATAITRLRPVRKAAGIEPRLSALLGTFLLMSLAVLPRPELPPIALAISGILVIIGMAMSFMVLRWLGKSFSIMAEARNLVTQGPYALVRHPLYICEEIAVLGRPPPSGRKLIDCRTEQHHASIVYCLSILAPVPAVFLKLSIMPAQN
jgi:protein-S-isoprenylcysteine O-methyltransferase Ste14